MVLYDISLLFSQNTVIKIYIMVIFQYLILNINVSPALIYLITEKMYIII